MANIPKANKHSDTAISQHLVPQCYMKEGAYNPRRTSVWIYCVKNDGFEAKHEKKIICKSKSIKKINAIDHYYDIKAGYYFMPQEALEEIYGPTMHLRVMLDDVKLDTKQKRHDRYGLFDKWIITDEEGVMLTEEERKELKKYFNETRFVFIEKEWGYQYENSWRTYIKDLYNKIVQISDENGDKNMEGTAFSTIISADTISEIMKCILVFDIRGFSSNEYINEQIENVFKRIPSEIRNYKINSEDRMHPIEATFKKSFKHQFILHLCYDALKGNQFSGNVKAIWDNYINKLVLRFCLTSINHHFVTSERPTFINISENGQKEQIFVVLPTMLISMGRGVNNHFYVSMLTEDEVDAYNKIIAKNNKYIISCSKNLNASKLWS